LLPKTGNWKKYLFEFTSIFVGVTLAFSLENWNENRREAETELKTLIEIRNGLNYDLEDLQGNISGHKNGLLASDYFRDLVTQQIVGDTTFLQVYRNLLRDFISTQNKAGFEALKSRGLDLIKNDTLRFRIITMYDFYYEIIEKAEEAYPTMQFHQNYFRDINDLLSPSFIFSDKGEFQGLKKHLSLSEKDKNKLLSYFVILKNHRLFAIKYYNLVISQIHLLLESIDKEIERLS
jgi:hypothetical protein